MDFELNETQKSIRQTFRDFVDKKVKPLAADIDEDKKFDVDFGIDANQKPSEPPKTVDQAVERLIGELPLKDKTTIASIAEDDLVTLQTNLGAYIESQFGIWSGNRELLESCEFISGDAHLHPDFAPSVIIKELWKCLRGAE